MADQLVSPSDLASLLERDDLDLYKATMLAECATAVVQAACGGQRIVEVTETLTIMGTTDSWLQIPQIPVTAVTSVELDGEALAAGTEPTDYKVVGSRLWRTDGWQTYCDYPSTIDVACTHGHPAGHQRLQLGRSAGLSILKGVYGNPTGATRETIDDYSVAYERLAAELETSEYLTKALRKQYGRRAGLVRLG
jgi:hypothetical protein